MKNLFIGIDFSKEKVDVAVIFAEGLVETSVRVFNEFKNSVSGYKQLVKWVEKNANGIDSSLWLFCGENTGDYSKPLCNHLYGRGFDMWLENSKCIKDASGIRRLKSDRADAAMIAEYAMRNHDKAIIYEPLSESLTQLREYYLYRQMVVRHRCSFEVRRGEKRLMMEKSAAKTVIAQSGKHIVSELNKEIAKIDRKIASLIESSDELSEVYRIVTYYGIAPFGQDSGTSVHVDPHVHYMANRHIKAMLTQAALAAVRFNPIIAQYYQRLIGRGKKMPVAMNNVKNKLLHIVTSMVKNKQVYKPEYRFSA